MASVLLFNRIFFLFILFFLGLLIALSVRWFRNKSIEDKERRDRRAWMIRRERESLDAIQEDINRRLREGNEDK